MKEEVLPLYLWPKGSDLSEVKAAVLDAKLPFKVAPYWFEPGKHDKCIALAEGFEFLTDHVYPKTHDARVASVKWFFGLLDLPQAHTVIGKLRSVFGEGTREVWDWPPSE